MRLLTCKFSSWRRLQAARQESWVQAELMMCWNVQLLCNRWALQEYTGGPKLWCKIVERLGKPEFPSSCWAPVPSQWHKADFAPKQRNDRSWDHCLASGGRHPSNMPATRLMIILMTAHAQAADGTSWSQKLIVLLPETRSYVIQNVGYSWIDKSYLMPNIASN